MLSTRWGLAVICGLSVTASSVKAADWAGPVQPTPGGIVYGDPAQGGAYPSYSAPHGNYESTYQGAPVGGAPVSGAPQSAGAPGGTYPVLNAPLYPSPVQYVPDYAGGTIITNQALAPHEMLYPHAYHAMYPPFYYRVTGHWFLTPFGVKQHENWKLEGTHVKVKYRDHYRPFSQFSPPVTH